MEPAITPLLLASTGVDVPDDQVEALLDYMNEILEERIGEAVVETLDDAQLSELAKLHETGSDQDIQTWMNDNVKDLVDIIQDETDILLGETAEHRDAFSTS